MLPHSKIPSTKCSLETSSLYHLSPICTPLSFSFILNSSLLLLPSLEKTSISQGLATSNRATRRGGLLLFVKDITQRQLLNARDHQEDQGKSHGVVRRGQFGVDCVVDLLWSGYVHRKESEISTWLQKQRKEGKKSNLRRGHPHSE
jgi:hypothetical protein